MDNREFAQLLLSEAADLLNESAGKNGMYRRAGNAMVKNEKKKNDEYDKKVENARKQYERAGYEDKAPAKADRYTEANYKYYADLQNKEYANARQGYKDSGSEKPYDTIAYNMNTIRPKDKKELTEKQIKLHERINKRGKRAQNESIAVLLTEAALLLNYED